MTNRTVTLEMSGDLYTSLQKRAERSHRSVEDETMDLSLGGVTAEENLWLACSLCNDHKSNRVGAPDPDSGDVIRLFDPRRQVWSDHFRWSEQADRIVGITPTGPTTVEALRLNPPILVKARQLWTLAGWHPPTDEA